MARRARGEGSVYQRKDGRWGGDFMAGDRRKTVYGKTQKEALANLQQARKAYEEGRLVDPLVATVATYLQEWLPIHVASGNLKPGSVHEYQKALRLYIAPGLGPVPLQKLSTEMIQRWVAGLLGHLAPSTVKHVYTILQRALADALIWRRIGHNPCMGVRLPKAKKFVPTVLTKQQAKMLVERVRAHRLECFLLLALTTGIREGELIGLKWNDVDLDAKKLRVKRTVSYLPNEKTGKWRNIETDPKSETSRRPIDLPQFVVDALRAHRAQQKAMQLAAGPGWSKRDLLFCSDQGEYWHRTTIYRHFKKLLGDSGLPNMRFHDLRHSAATILIAMGVSLKVVQELLGHSDAATTLRFYGHSFPDDQSDAMGKINDFYG